MRNHLNNRRKSAFLHLPSFTFPVFFSLLLTCSCLAQTPSELFPAITNFKLQYPLSESGKDYTGVDYEKRDQPFIKNASAKNLAKYQAPSHLRPHFFLSGKELVFRAHCAGALTSINAYPRCELRQLINGKDSFWDYADEHELKVTLRITELPLEKQEVCVVQLKGTNTPNKTSNTSEVLRVEYRQDGKSGWHLEVNESSGPKNILTYKLGQTVKIRVYVKDHQIKLEMKNLSNGDSYELAYTSDYSHGYFKTGAYTQSSIWKQKTGVRAEKPTACSEVRFSKIQLGSKSN